MKKAELLDKAKEAVTDRGLNYGRPEDNFKRIAGLWNIYLRDRYGVVAVIEPIDVAGMMVLMKVARLENTPTHLDSWTDIAGYAACGAELAETHQGHRLTVGAVSAFGVAVDEARRDYPAPTDVSDS